MTKVLVATEKPFAPVAVEGIKKEIEAAGFELALLEKYTEKAQLLDAVKDVDALIIRSDKVTAEVLDAAKNLKIVVRAGAGYDTVHHIAAALALGTPLVQRHTGLHTLSLRGVPCLATLQGTHILTRVAGIGHGHGEYIGTYLDIEAGSQTPVLVAEGGIETACPVP